MTIKDEICPTVKVDARLLDDGTLWIKTDKIADIGRVIVEDGKTSYKQFYQDAQPEQRWIPCSERLPESTEAVNVTWVNRKPEFYYSDIKDKPYTATAVYFRGKWYWYSCVIEDWIAEYGSNESFLANLQEAVDRDIEIIAWQPLPKPWEGDAE